MLGACQTENDPTVTIVTAWLVKRPYIVDDTALWGCVARASRRNFCEGQSHRTRAGRGNPTAKALNRIIRSRVHKSVL
jgi:hypothetical protein